MNKFLAVVMILSYLVFPALGQELDTLSTTLDSIYSLGAEPIFQADSLLLDSLSADSLLADLDYTHSPMKATMYALVLPGLGQAYNKKYWKMPIVWAGMGGMVYAISYNSKNYRIAVDDYAIEPSDKNERILKYWRKNMELSFIGMFVVYTLQVLDAYVDAHMHNWNVNENLSMGVTPSLQPLMHPASLTGQAVGLTCSLKIRGR
jgi:hypothetical protein